jgi:uroporphyrinogen decarboxylase
MAELNWTSRVRVEVALAHREADRVPFDFGGSVVTGIHEKAYRRLRRYLKNAKTGTGNFFRSPFLARTANPGEKSNQSPFFSGLPDVEVEIDDHVQQIARVHDDVKEHLGVDVYGIRPGAAAGFAMPEWTDGGYHKIRDEWGIEWWMPLDGGFYHDMRRHPLADARTLDDLKRFPFPNPLDPARFEGMAEQADFLMNTKRVAYSLGGVCAGIFEMALWLSGFEKFYGDLLADRPLAEALLDILCEIKMQFWQRALEGVGANVMIVHEGDDLAAQDRPLLSPALYREVVKPRHARIIRHIKEHATGDVKVSFHSCGAVAPFIPDLVEIGVDLLNPVQVSAAGMDARALKRRWGDDLTFYGGAVDPQRVLPHGTPQEVRDEVRRRIDDLAPGGGFIFAPIHNIQADVPPENIVAMWEALREYGKYT